MKAQESNVVMLATRPAGDRKPAARTIAEAFSLNASQRAAAFSAVTSVVEASLSTDQRHAILAFAAATLEIDPANATHVATEEISAAFTTEAERLGMAHALVVAACMGGKVTLEAEVRVKTIVTVLGVQSHWVDLLGALRKGSILKIKRALFSRSPDARRILKRTWEEAGLKGMLGAVLFVTGLFRDRALASRFRELERLPRESLGFRFFNHVSSRGLSFPGEKGGMPERMVHHDLMHVVNGYDTDGSGECQLAGFYAGFTEGDAFTFIMIVLATFQLGLKVSPAAVTPTVGAFDPQLVVEAYLRGRRLQVDVMGAWDYWALMPLSVHEAQQQLGIIGNFALSKA